MNTKQLIEMCHVMDNFWIWKYPNGNRVFVSHNKSIQLDEQRKQYSHADMRTK